AGGAGGGRAGVRGGGGGPGGAGGDDHRSRAGASSGGRIAAPPTYPLVPYTPPAGGLDPRGAAARLVEAFLAGRSPQTLRAYRKDLEDFAGFLGVATVEAIPGALLGAGQGAANEVVRRYRAHLQARGLAPATVNRRLTANRSLVKLARVLGLVPWALDVDGVRSETYRDTRGPGRQGFRRLLAALEGREDAKGLRDRALLRLLFDLGLRRAAAVPLDVAGPGC